MKYRKRVEYAPATSPFENFVGQNNNPSLLASIVYSIVLFVVLFVINVAVGPIVDWFTVWLTTDPLNAGNPYVSGVLSLFSWWYIFILLTAGIGYFIIWKSAIISLIYGRNY